MMVGTPRVVHALLLAGLCAFLMLPRSARGVEKPAARPDPSIRVLILSDDGGRGFDSSVSAIRKILNASGRFETRVCEAPAGLSARTLADFDLVVDDVSDSETGDETHSAIGKFVESGKGLVVTRRALEGVKAGSSARSVPAYWPLFRGVGSPSVVQFVDIKMTLPNHPISRGIKPAFRNADRILRGLGTATGAEVIARAIDDPKRGGSGNAEPVLATTNLGKGRVVGFGLGSDLSAMHEPEFRILLARACEWAATGSVTLGTELNIDAPEPGAVKALLITGGHDHEAAFYKLFSGYHDLNWIPIEPSTTAFKKDLRGKYEVIIMYDFSRDLDDVAKKNLRSFVESGGGVVVLHHALLNYQNWDWWIGDVVGGSYRLTRTGDVPSSRVKDNQQIYVTPAMAHPIIAGIEPFHIQDEAYKGLRMSPKVRPLLTTDNPTSDINLAWVGPDERFRVAAIQLGHGQSAFSHPSYRAVVHNAILWAAGKIK